MSYHHFVLPFLAFITGLGETIEIFITVYTVLMILGDITAGTIYNCFFNVGKAFFVIFYLLSLAGDSVFMVSYQNFNLTADLTMLYTIAALLGLLGLAKAVMQAIIFMSERAETCIKPWQLIPAWYHSILLPFPRFVSGCPGLRSSNFQFSR